MKLLWVSPIFAETKIDEAIQQEIHTVEKALKLNICDGSKVIRWNCGAKDFMENRLNIKNLEALFPQDEELFPEVKLEESMSITADSLSPLEE